LGQKREEKREKAIVNKKKTVREERKVERGENELNEKNYGRSLKKLYH